MENNCEQEHPHIQIESLADRARVAETIANAHERELDRCRKVLAAAFDGEDLTVCVSCQSYYIDDDPSVHTCAKCESDVCSSCAEDRGGEAWCVECFADISKNPK